MSSYLLAWNPDRWEWTDLESLVSTFRRGEIVRESWSCGRNKRITTGDRVFFIKLGKEPRGIFGYGTVTRPSYEDVHWSDPNKTSQYVGYQIDSIVNPETEPILPRSRLDEEPFASVHWSTQSSGISIPDDVALALHQEWLQFVNDNEFSLPDELPTSPSFFEGAKRIIVVNAYERSEHARDACISHYGAECVICGFNFGVTYGPDGEGLIHVHHLVSLASIGDTYELDPIEDLRPVCPNCHAMIHHRKEPYSLDDVKRMIGGNQ